VADLPVKQDQVFESSLLDLVLPTGRPKYLGAYQSSNQLTNALAHLVGQDGLYSRLLACDANGVLKVQAEALDTIAGWDLSGLAAAVAAIQVAAEVVSGWNGGWAIDNIAIIATDIDAVWNCLSDVWDTAQHAIRTTT
jgi:hypothetical protein